MERASWTRLNRLLRRTHISCLIRATVMLIGVVVLSIAVFQPYRYEDRAADFNISVASRYGSRAISTPAPVASQSASSPRLLTLTVPTSSNNLPSDGWFKDLIGLVQILVSWPVVVAIALALFYRPLSLFMKSLAGRNFQSIKVSIFQVGVELSTASEFKPSWDVSGTDLRFVQGGELGGSGKPALFEQFRGTQPLDYTLFDIGDGKQWLTSRLYIFAIMLERMRGVRCLVFVETKQGVNQRFLGVTSPREIRWKLAMLYPWLETAYVRALNQLQMLPYQGDPMYPAPPSGAPHPIVSVYGAMRPADAEAVVNNFLHDSDIQQYQPQAPNNEYQLSNEWTQVTRPDGSQFWEHAQWIDETWIFRQRDVIDAYSSVTTNLEDASVRRSQAVAFRQDKAFVALVDAEKQLIDRIVDRHDLLEKVMANLRQQVTDTESTKS